MMDSLGNLYRRLKYDDRLRSISFLARAPDCSPKFASAKKVGCGWMRDKSSHTFPVHSNPHKSSLETRNHGGFSSIHPLSTYLLS